ncbi:MAG: hypothetical protein NC180_12645 [Muribaculaceae bacterium]|nr:hypothetical protein [Roseburia sp.]MCM1432275.1 hypothetical protein [Muribaculaceae bacterium]MCM1494051.1 hypothetical protein [Muribaculaceae bacterium]
MSKNILLWAVFLILGFALLFIGVTENIKYMRAMDFSQLDRSRLQTGNYVTGNISDSLRLGCSERRYVLGAVYKTYTIPMRDGQNIRVRVSDPSKQTALESGGSAHLSGIVTRDKNGLLIRETSINTKSALGFGGVMILECCLMLFLTGSLKKNVTTETSRREAPQEEECVYNLDAQIGNEIIVLDQLERQRDSCRIGFYISFLVCVFSVCLVFLTFSWGSRLSGFLLFILSLRFAGKYFLNLDNRVSLFICRLFDLDSVSEKLLKSQERLSWLREQKTEQ